MGALGFCAGPFVLCTDGCCRQRCRNTNFGPENFFHHFEPSMLGPTPPLARQVGQPQPKPPSRHSDQGGGGGGGGAGLGKRASGPSPQSNFLPAPAVADSETSLGFEGLRSMNASEQAWDECSRGIVFLRAGGEGVHWCRGHARTSNR